MDDRVVQFRVGVMVLASLLVTGILVVLFGELPSFARKIFQPTYTVRLWFPEGRGVVEDALVRRNGILVGRVTEVRFVEKEKDKDRPEGVDEAEYYTGVLVTTEIRKDAKLYQHDVCSIQADLLGKPSLHFLRPAGQPPSQQLLEADKVQRGRITPNPLDALGTVTTALADLTPNVNAASMALANAGDAIGQAAQNVNAILDADTQAQIKTVIARANESLESIQNMIGDKETQAELKAALNELPESLKEFKRTMVKAQARLDDVQAFTEKLGRPETIDRLDRSTQHLDQIMNDLAVFSETLRNPRGSLGLLLQDRQLYDHLNKAAENVDNLSRRLEPIVNDVRVFTDKIARHPERLGARGALQRYPGVK